jgi:membrane-associated protease RseP (regulator of RpoE activity)
MRSKLVLGLLAIASAAVADPEPTPSDPYAEPAAGDAPAPPAPRPAPQSAPAPRSTSPRTDVTVRVGHGPLGIVALEISPELRMHLGAPRDRGVLVDAVMPNTLAAKAGLKVGDLVLEIDNAPVGSANDVIAAVGKHKKGDQIMLDVMRTGIPTTLRATLDQDPPTWPRFEQRFRSFGSGGGAGDLDRWFDDVAPFGAGDMDRQLRQQLEDMRRRLEEMERRFEPKQKKPLAPQGDPT